MTDTEFTEDMIEWESPEVYVGQTVLWYRHAVISDRPEIGVVKFVRNRSVNIILAGNIGKTGVRHSSDPKLNVSDAMRENGSWQYTEDFRETRRRILDLENTIAIMNIDKNIDREKLVKLAKDSGCEFKGRPSNDNLMLMLKDKGVDVKQAMQTR